MSVGLSIIALNEEDALPNLLASVDGCFDRVVLLDTGSTDKTIEVFQTWAREQSNMTFAVARYEWLDDFSDARNAADGLLLYGDPKKYESNMPPMVDWRAWADCDDIITGAQNIRRIAETAPADVNGFFAGYNYAQDGDVCVCYLHRERIVRATYGRWLGRVHEAIPIHDGIRHLPASDLEYIHRKAFTPEAAAGSNERNVRILEKWDSDEPDNPRIVGYLGTENAIRGRLQEALSYFQQYIGLKTGWDQERAQIYRKYVQTLIGLERWDEAYDIAFEPLRVLPDWPDNYLTLAEVSMARSEWSKGLTWAKRAFELGQPETLLIINPLDYTFHAMKLMAGCLGNLGAIDEAIAMAEKALALIPHDGPLRTEYQRWTDLARREHTANTYVMAAQQLMAFDEQWKAKVLLEQCVPHFAMEHPAVVAIRSQLRERIMWTANAADFADHYETGGSKPEDFIKDEDIDPLCNYLPRTNFLLDGLKEQMNATQE